MQAVCFVGLENLNGNLPWILSDPAKTDLKFLLHWADCAAVIFRICVTRLDYDRMLQVYKYQYIKK